jgi:hypothetical protein
MKKNTFGDSGKTKPIYPPGIKANFKIREAQPGKSHALAGPGATLSFSDRFDRLSEMRPCSGIGKYDQY